MQPNTQSNGRVCTICSKTVLRTQPSTLCSKCSLIFHNACVGDSTSEIRSRTCTKCIRASPTPSLLLKPPQLMIQPNTTQNSPLFYSPLPSTPSPTETSVAIDEIRNQLDSAYHTQTSITPADDNNTQSSKRALSESPNTSPSNRQPAKLQCIASTQSLGAMETNAKQDLDNLPREVPWYIQAMWRENRGNHETLIESISALSDRVVAVERRVDNIVTDRSNDLKSKSLVDPCELRFSGLPPDSLADMRDTIKTILAVIQRADAFNFVTRVRQWYPTLTSTNDPNQTTSSQSVTGNNASQASRTANVMEVTAEDRAAGTVTIVAEFVSPKIRDSVLRSAFALKEHTMKSIFGIGADTPIFINPIYPAPVYRLLKASLGKYKELRYLKPIVVNLTVFMRPSAGVLLPITSLAIDLHNLKPNQ